MEASEIRPTGNSLLLHFLSAKKIALELEKEHGRVRAGSVNLAHPSRVYVRKAQYDWRSVMISCSIAYVADLIIGV